MKVMLSRIFAFCILLMFSSCALFKSANIQDKKIEELLSFLPAEGEGRGRLGLHSNQYLFGFEAVLKENKDWLLAANIPLHGEEILLFPDLQKTESLNETTDGLELRIERGISDYLVSQKKSPALGKTFLLELRGIIRLVLHRQLGEKVTCSKEECRFGENIYQVKSSSEQLALKKSIGQEYEIEFVALNLKGSHFKRTSIFLHSQNRASSAPSLLSLELFWN